MSCDHIIPADLSSTITLNDGVVMPMFGLGTARLSSSEAVETASFALQNGYRLIDTAAYYQNEQEIGLGIRKSGILREDVFVVTKLVWDDHGYERCKMSFTDSLNRLDTSYVDLYLIHSPHGGDIVRTYDAVLELKAKGLIRSVGVSNFGVQHLEGLRQAGRPVPSVNQIELHPMKRQQHIVDYCRERGIAVMGYSPMAKADKMNDDQLATVASSYSKSVAQLMIRWSVQKGYITIPKTSKPERVLQNADVFDWTVSPDDIKCLEALPEYSCMGMVDLTASDWDQVK